ncbi:hypothetical protein NL493_30575, partial [Klebsiella pneumoniae]|nr:hypothetical protein [Klebsiella pneumoniae]
EYREHHKQLVKLSSQRLITDYYIVARKLLTQNETEVGANSVYVSFNDKSDFTPVYKRTRIFSNMYEKM